MFHTMSMEQESIQQINLLLTAPDALSRISEIKHNVSSRLDDILHELYDINTSELSAIQTSINSCFNNQQQINKLNNNLITIDKYCDESAQLFNPIDWEYIESINAARINVDTILSLQDKYASLPDQCKQLENELVEDHTIVDVYRKFRRLVVLRDNALLQQTKQSSLSPYKNQPEYHQQLIQSFAILQNISDTIFNTITENITDSHILCSDDPTTLVLTLQVCVLEDGAKRKVLGSTTCINDQSNSQLITMKQYVLNTLESNIAGIFRGLCRSESDEQAIKRAASSDDQQKQSIDELAVTGTNARSDYILNVLDNMRVLCDELFDVLAQSDPCYPPDYNIVQFLEQRYRHWMLFTLQFHTTDIIHLSKKALLKSCQWIQWYQQRMSDLTYDKNESNDLTRITSMCMIEYTRSTASDILNKLVSNIINVEQSSAAERDADGFYITTGPSDLFLTLSTQIDIVLNQFSLHDQPLSYVILMIADTITYYQNETLKFISTVNQRDIDGVLLFGTQMVEKQDTYFCAIINNCYQSIDNIDEIKQRCLERIQQNTTAKISTSELTSSGTVISIDGTSTTSTTTQSLYQQMSDTFDECGDGFVSVSAEATDILVLIIITTCQPSLVEIFGTQWLHSATHTHNLISTINDYMTDYKQWIRGQAYFMKVLKSLLHSIVTEYISKVCDVKLHIDSQFIERLGGDIDLLNDAFVQYELLPRKQIDDELSVLYLIIDIIQCEYEYIPQYFASVSQRFTTQSHDIIDSLLSARNDITRSQRKLLLEQLDEMQVMEQQAVSDGQRGNTKIIPARSNDTTIQHINVNKNIFQRFVSRNNNKRKKLKPKQSVLINKQFVQDNELILNVTAMSPTVSIKR